MTGDRPSNPSFSYVTEEEAFRMRTRRVNRAQRMVVVVGLAAALWFVGGWATTSVGATGWVGYAPLTNAVNVPPGGLHPWARLLIWLALVLVWVLASFAVLRSSADSGSGD
jgi:hypothetical protein